jgi:hypothetical protein
MKISTGRLQIDAGVNMVILFRLSLKTLTGPSRQVIHMRPQQSHVTTLLMESTTNSEHNKRRKKLLN